MTLIMAHCSCPLSSSDPPPSVFFKAYFVSGLHAIQVTEELTVISRRLVKERMSLRLATSSEADSSFCK